MLSESVIKNINKVLSSAYEDRRDMLYEYEIYRILRYIGLGVPEYVLIESLTQLNESVLEKFRGSVVVKVVSSQIAHKQKVGGVRIVENLSVQYVHNAISEMRETVLSHFDIDLKPEIKGFLLVEFIPFAQTLGSEVLFGFKQDYAFGPVLTLSKGGDDAEFFAKYYDPANLIISPMDFSSTMIEMDKTLNIRHKFEDTEHSLYLKHLAEAASVLSQLAYVYSDSCGNKQEFIISAMDINPFVFSKDGKFVAVDGFAQFEPANKAKSLPAIRTDNLKSFFNPQGIAVVGVSADLAKYSLGREIGKLLHCLERKDLYFINGRGGVINFENKEYTLYKSLNDISGNIDLIVYAAPVQFTLDFIKDLPENSMKAIIMISGIPADMKYSDFKNGLDGILPKETRVIGPNCMGVFYAPGINKKGINTLFIEEKKLQIKSSYRSNTALLSQSGALAVTMLDKLNKFRLFKAVVSFGNKYDVKVTDLVSYFDTVEEIELIALYVEGFDEGEGRVFFELAKSISKPVVVYKSGKTEAGARAAASHTASMSGNYEVFKAACRQAGVVLAENIGDYEDYVKIFSLLSHKVPSGNRLAAVFNAGFESTIGADELCNLKQAKLSDNTKEKLQKADRYKLVDVTSSFLDITPMADDKTYADFVEAVLQDENVDCVFVSVVPHTNALKTLPECCSEPGGLAARLADLFNKYDKPVIVSVNAGSLYRDFVSVMEENGMPVYSDVRSAIKSLDRFVSHYIKCTNTKIGKN